MYGTKSQTIIAIDRSGGVRWHERTRGSDAAESGEWDESFFAFAVGGGKANRTHRDEATQQERDAANGGAHEDL